MITKRSEDDDEAASKRGICHVTYNPGSMTKSLSLGNILEASSLSNRILTESLPFRFTSYHFCYNNPAMKLLLSAIQMALSKEWRIRLRMHYGSPTEIQYSLSSFGIHCLEIFDDHNDDDGHGSFSAPNSSRSLSSSSKSSRLAVYGGRKYWDRQKKIEDRLAQLRLKREGESGIILHPTPDDVLVGRGHAYREYIGNTRYQTMIESQLDAYNVIPDKFEKTCMTMNLVKEFRTSGGRFLAPIAGVGWKALDDDEARQKTAISLRSKNGRTRKAATATMTKNVDVKDTRPDYDSYISRPSFQLTAAGETEGSNNNGADGGNQNRSHDVTAGIEVVVTNNQPHAKKRMRWDHGFFSASN